MGTTLRNRVIRLAHENPALRPHLLPILKEATVKPFHGNNPDVLDPQDRHPDDDIEMKKDIFAQFGRLPFYKQVTVSGLSNVLHPPAKLKAGLAQSLPWMTAEEMNGVYHLIQMVPYRHQSSVWFKALREELYAMAWEKEQNNPGMSLKYAVDDVLETAVDERMYDGDFWDYIEAPSNFDRVINAVRKDREIDKEYEEVAKWMVHTGPGYLR